MSQKRIAANLEYLQQHFEQHVNPRGRQTGYFRYSFGRREDDPMSAFARLEYSQGTGSSSLARYIPLEALDVEETRFRAFVAGTARAIVENVPRFLSDLVLVDVQLLEDVVLVDEADLSERVAQTLRENAFESAVSCLETVCEHLEVELPEDRPDYLELLQALLMYDIFDADFEALLDDLSSRLKALPIEERPEATRWIVITANWSQCKPHKVIWRGQELPLWHGLVLELGALHREWHGADIPRIPRRGDENVVERQETRPVIQWSSDPHPVLRIPMAQSVTWRRSFRNVGEQGAGVSISVTGDFIKTSLVEPRLVVNGVERPLHVSFISGAEAQIPMPLDPSSEHHLELTFQARGGGGGIIDVGVMAWVPSEDTSDGMGSVSSELKETLQVFVG
ncbi:hypothetical protein [Vitiosangium sp. GDMCC 1.1324]|uniref:hypothetical protein n=1 Tax=Vitiosangium sp. (strain GDMCC 1.1324) TaxID=2138576 RepID=UPI000D3D6889|nr:hypothetical protein [Vitiosangium sp. GDMCC 1.1324]PTL79973.1 hypothetical protein DAT35_31625 [Vitiosangium sp. GDMCC 1.1324]